jgi:hypothetical protein
VWSGWPGGKTEVLTLNIDLKSSRCIIPAGSKIIINKASILDQRIVIVLTHWNNSPRVNMSLHPHTFCWFRANLSLCSFFIIYVQKWRLVDSWTFTNIFSQYKQQVTNRSHVITNQTDRRRTFWSLEISKYRRELKRRIPIHIYQFIFVNCNLI